MRLSARTGHLLAEALCALALTGVLAAAAAVALGTSRRSLAASEAAVKQLRAARESTGIVAALLRDADSVVVLGDTAARASVLIVSSAACAIEGSRRAILLPPADVSSGEAITARAQHVEPGDAVTVTSLDSLARHELAFTSLVDSVTERTASSPCGPLDGWTHAADAGARRVRLVLRDPLPASITPGAPVRVTRSGRLALYHAGSGDWMLGWRRCASDGTACGAIQPVAGPLTTPGRGGLRIRRVGVDGLVIMARAPGPLGGDSLFLRLRSGAP